MKQAEILAAFGNIMKRLFPELSAGTHLPAKARVTGVHGQAGQVRMDGLGSRRYSLDVQLLTPDGQPDESRPALQDVPLEVAWAGPQRGVFALPAVGSVVRVAWYGGSPAHPYIDGVVPDGYTLPAVAPGEFLLQHSASVQVWVRASGQIEVVSDQPVLVNTSSTLKVHADQHLDVTSSASISVDAPTITLAGGGEPLARVGDEVQVVGITPGPAVATGTIISGSPRVTSG